MKPLSIYLGHMTYTTPGSESKSYPINIGYLKAYAMKKFKTEIDIKLFIFVDEICEAIKSDPPDIVGLSFYIWNTNLSENIFKYAKSIDKNIITIVGGPNLPVDNENKVKFWRKRHSYIDFEIFGEGEETFNELIETHLASPLTNRDNLNIKGVEYYDSTKNKVITGDPRDRIKNIEDSIPSPILEGYLDPFIHLEPQLQGVRGCPYGCKFCNMGSSYFNKVFHFSYERMVDEIEYVRKHNKLHNILSLTDDNFGMFDIDLKLIEYCQDSYEKTGWPIQIRVATAKKITKGFMNAALKAPDMIRVACHFQSLNEDTLQFIKRVGPTDGELDTIYKNFRESKSVNLSETALIIPMPNETYNSYREALKRIIDEYKIEHCSVQTLSTFWGCGFEGRDVQEEFGMKNKYRLEHGSFGEFDGFTACEIDRVCIETNTFSEEEYYEARLFYFFCTIFYFKRNFFYLRSYLTGLGLSIYEWIDFLFENRSSSSSEVNKFFNRIDEMSRNELFDSPQEIESFWEDAENRRKTLGGEFGFNISQMVLGQLGIIYNDLLDFTLHRTKEFLNEKKISFSIEVDELIQLMKSLRLNKLNSEEIEKDISEDFSFDFIKWHEDDFQNPLSVYYQENRLNMSLAFSEEQKNDLKKLVLQNPEKDPVSVSKFYSRVLPRRYFRALSYSGNQ
jgi:radical SAM superfamily enzyme YgiQ (UPF0313 family)